MTVTVNGESHNLNADTTIALLLDTLGLNREATVVQHNDAIIEREAFELVTLHDGDVVELVRIVGGG